MNVLKAINERSDTIDINVKSMTIINPCTIEIKTDDSIKFHQYARALHDKKGYSIRLVSEYKDIIAIKDVESFQIERNGVLEYFSKHLDEKVPTTTVTLKLNFDLAQENMMYLVGIFKAQVDLQHYSFESIQ